ncbi:STAS domain-containing protein [Sinorhizobium sp. 7-81]|uniref:STAS domain-containing protein n=1 Tax=Sinorhizobium sp. 7-81 TaxID=3049087 RepID=UPI0034DEA67A
MEFIFALIALFGPISFGVLEGVVTAIAATLVYILRKTMFPRDALLGRVSGRDGFYKLHRVPAARPVPGFTVYMVQGSLLFFNTDYVRARLRTVTNELPADTRWFVMDASAIAQIDISAAAMLEEVHDDLGKRGIALAIAELHFEAREILERAGVIAKIGPEDGLRGSRGCAGRFRSG